MRVACAQMAPVLGDPVGNRSRSAAAITAAVAAGAELVVLPELATSGYAIASREEADALSEPAEGPSVAAWRAAAGTATVIGGIAERAADGTRYDSAVCVRPDAPLVVYRKVHLWGREPEWFTPGDRPGPIVETRAGRVGIGVCYDLFFPEFSRSLALGGADVIAFPTASPLGPENDCRPTMDELVARVTAYVNRVWVAVADRCEAERGIQWVGGTVIVDPMGQIAAAAAPTRTETILADCPVTRARDKRFGSRNSVLSDRVASVDALPPPD